MHPHLQIHIQPLDGFNTAPLIAACRIVPSLSGCSLTRPLDPHLPFDHTGVFATTGAISEENSSNIVQVLVRLMGYGIIPFGPVQEGALQVAMDVVLPDISGQV